MHFRIINLKFYRIYLYIKYLIYIDILYMRTTRIIKISDSNTELGVESKEPEVVEKINRKIFHPNNYLITT